MKATLFCLWVALISIASAQCARAESFSFSTPAGYPGQTPVLGKTGDGTNAGARFKSPSGVSLDANTNLFLTDATAVRKMSKIAGNWVVTTLAGDIAQHGASDGTNENARFDDPQGIAIDSSGIVSGIVYVADTINNAIRRIVPVGTNWVVTTIAGAGRDYPGANDGSNIVARFNHPYGIAVDASGSLFVADTYSQTIRKIILVGTNWVVTTIAGSAAMNGATDGTNENARFDTPVAIAIDSSGNFYVADFNNNTIRKGTPSGTNWIVTTIAGLATAPPGSVDGTNGAARFFEPQGIALDASNNVYVSDAGNSTIRKVKPVGTNWVVTTLGGQPGVTGANDGTGSVARFNNPYALAITASGSLFLADAWNNTVRSGRLAILLEGRVSGGKFVLSWPAVAAGYVVEAAASPTAVSWNQQLSAVITNGDTCFQTNSPGSGSTFYRLHKLP
jgi:hypothetical protein